MRRLSRSFADGNNNVIHLKSQCGIAVMNISRRVDVNATSVRDVTDHAARSTGGMTCRTARVGGTDISVLCVIIAGRRALLRFAIAAAASSSSKDVLELHDCN